MDLATRMARLLVEYSVSVRPGDKVLIEATTEAIPLVRELYRYILRAGGHPIVQLAFPGQNYVLFQEGSDAQIGYADPLREQLMEHIDAALRIYSEANTRELSNFPVYKQHLRTKAEWPIMARFWERQASGAVRWCVAPWPTTAQAMEAGMSDEEFADRVATSCFLDKPDPAAEWARVSVEQQRLCDLLATMDSLHVTAPGTDLVLSVLGRVWDNCDGHKDLPDGEIFTGPVEDSVYGHIAYHYPILSRGREILGLVLTFDGGHVVEVRADQGAEVVQEALKIPGADRLGEFAIGTNYGIQSRVRQILFDEKIGGTIHTALGNGYPETGSQNRSPLHWDLVSDMHEGQITADGKLIYDKGRFVV
jgi:aminopeptidase